MILSKIKVYALTLLGLLAGGLMIAVKILAGRNSRLTKELETKDAKIHHAKVVEQKKTENAEVFKSRRAEAKTEIKKTGVSKELSEPNEW